MSAVSCGVAALLLFIIVFARAADAGGPRTSGWPCASTYVYVVKWLALISRPVSISFSVQELAVVSHLSSRA